MNTRYGYVDEAAIRADRIRQLASRAEYLAVPIAAFHNANVGLIRCACGRLTQSPTGDCPGCRRKP